MGIHFLDIHLIYNLIIKGISMNTVKNIGDYIEHIGNIKNTLKTYDLLVLNNIRLMIVNKLNDEASHFSIYLRSLPETDKITLIRALICNDREMIFEMISPKLSNAMQKINADENLLKEIASIKTYDGEQWFNNTSEIIINTLLKNKENNDLSLIDVDRILTNVMAKIPDMLIDVPTKKQICENIDDRKAFPFVEYNEPVHALKKNVSLGHVSLDVLKKASLSNNFDYSEYILLVLGLLQKAAEKNSNISDLLQNIKSYYYETNYEFAMKVIKELCTDYKDEIDALHTPEAAELIWTLSSTASEVSMETNYSRRFFENRIASLYFGQGMKLDSINRINARFMGAASGGNYSHASNVSEAITGISALSESEDEKIGERRLEIRSQVQWMKQKGRKIKDGFVAKDNEDKKHKSRHEVYSRNMGTMTSSQPNYLTDISVVDLRNTNPDINTYTKDTSHYPLTRNRSAYVASISGHAFAVVAMLEKYALENKGNSAVSDDINHYILALMSTYAGRGYHSLLEVQDIFTHTVVHNIFESCGISLNVLWPDTIFDQAFKDAQSYTRELILRRVIRSELIAHTNIFNAIKRGDQKHIIKILNQLDPDSKNSINNDGNAILHLFAVQNEIALTRILLGDERVNVNLLNKDGKSALYIAIKNNNLEMVKLLLSCGANLAAKHKHEKTLIDYAKSHEMQDLLRQAIRSYQEELTHDIKKMDIDKVRKLVGGMKVNPNYLADSSGNTPLHIAALLDNVEIVRILLKNGANPTIGNAYNMKPEDYAQQQDLQILLQIESTFHRLIMNIEYYDEDEIKSLLNVIKDHPDKTNIQGDSFLHIAALITQSNITAEIISYGANPNKHDYNGMTPLFLAVIAKNINTAKALLDCDETDINARDQNNFTPLHYSANAGNYEMVKLLLKHGATPVLSDNNKKLAFHYAATKEIKKLLHNEILFANLATCYKDLDLRTLNFLIDIISTRPDIADVSESTFLHYAATYNDEDGIKQLIKNGANINVCNCEGFTPLHIAIMDESYAAAKTLLKYENINPNIEDKMSYTPLMRAILKKDMQAIHLLLGNECVDINRMSKGAALHMASGIGNYEIVKLLLSRDANLFLIDKFGKIPLDYASDEKIKITIISAMTNFNVKLDQCITLGDVNGVMKLLAIVPEKFPESFSQAANGSHPELAVRLAEEELKIVVARYLVLCKSNASNKLIDDAKENIKYITANLAAARIKSNLKNADDGLDECINIESTADLIRQFRKKIPPLPCAPQVRVSSSQPSQHMTLAASIEKLPKISLAQVKCSQFKMPKLPETPQTEKELMHFNPRSGS